MDPNDAGSKTVASSEHFSMFIHLVKQNSTRICLLWWPDGLRFPESIC